MHAAKYAERVTRRRTIATTASGRSKRELTVQLASG
jgi:hypothetical protein